MGCSNIAPVKEGEGIKISGTITYDRVPLKQGNYGLIALDYNNIKKVSGKNLYIKAVDENGLVLYTTTSDSKGRYSVYVPENTPVKIRVYARMYKKDVWDVSVVDNTNMKATYVMEGSLIDSGTTSSIRNLHASSGWDGEGYSGQRTAAPFAILDSINTVMQKVITAKPNISFPQLTVNWSVNNVAASGDRSIGQIVTSNYDGENNLWILGDANSDTDEYDDHIIIHEWGHYFEDKFSRSDSIGGPHSTGDYLDIRVAFGEGWGNAISAIATDNPIYFDTSGYAQGSGWSMNIESAQPENPGWFSEASVQRIIYDLYDKNQDGRDNLNLGFKPIFNAMVSKERNTPAFTSIFSFIHALKSENPSKSYKIDEIVASEQIASISDDYGKYRSNLAGGIYTTPIYRDLRVGQSIRQCNQNQYGVYNKLGNRTFIKVNIDKTGFYTFDAQPYGGAYGDPDIVIYKAQYPLESMGMSPLEGSSSDSLSINLTPGKYLVEVYDASFNNSCFVVKLNKEAGTYKPVMSKGQIKRKPLKMPQY
ncbi:hypothetical protein MNB_SV-14-158 [hydrothermal vent metagenome]|uniref:Uncharacterized protein n=1 Tax=hydrothermal vent metagenome TaxID=652676 RepID=A0A1W1CP81_9ZZZZ